VGLGGESLWVWGGVWGGVGGGGFVFVVVVGVCCAEGRGGVLGGCGT